MHHICHVTWDCMLCNVKCIVTRSLNLKWSLTCEIVQELPQQHSPLSDCDWSTNSSICNSCSSSDWNHPFISSFAFSICKTSFFLQNVTIFRFLFVFYIFSRQVVSNHFLSLMIHWNLFSFWSERWSFFPSSSLDSFILEFDWSPNHSLFYEDGFEFKIWLSKTFNNDTYL